MAGKRREGGEHRTESLASGMRVPPNSLEAERAVLGGILLENHAISTVVEILSSEDFYSQANHTIFDAMAAIYNKGQPVDHITLREHLAQAGKLALVGGDEYLLSLTDTIPSVENIEHHAKIVAEKAVIRRLITACHEIAASGYGDYGEYEKFLDQAEKSVFDVAKERAKNPYEILRTVLLKTFDTITENANRKRTITGLPTGFYELDELTSGMNPGDLIIIAGRPGMGKTAFALNVAVNASSSQHHGTGYCPVAVFSLEMPKEQLAQRMLANEAKVDSKRMRQGRLLQDDWRNLAVAAGKLSELPIFIDDTAAISLLEVRAKARRIKAEHGLSLIVIDYLQLMRSGSKTDSREQEISEISRTLKALAKDLGIPIIALSQLNRAVETRSGKDKRPQLSDLRESGAIEQDADTIWFVYRDEVYFQDTTQDRGIAEIIVGKQRAGATGTCRLRFIAENTRFENLEESAVPPPGFSDE